MYSGEKSFSIRPGSIDACEYLVRVVLAIDVDVLSVGRRGWHQT